MKSTTTKEKIFRDAFGLFTNGYIPYEIFNAYMNDSDGEGSLRMQCWCIGNVRGDVMDWITGIGVVEAVELLYKSAIENGTI